MNTTSSIRHLFATACLSISGLILCSCQSSVSPNKVADRLETAAYTQVYGFNGAAAPSSRQFQPYGAIPERAHRALVEWMRSGTWKNFDYAMPQYFIETLVPSKTANKGNSSIWSICTDSRGNLLGILVSSSGDARNVPAVGGHKLIDNTTPRRAELAHSIMKTLEPCDSYRKACRKSLGLTTPEVQDIPVITSKPTATRPAGSGPAKPAAATTGTTADPAASATDDPFGTGAETPATPAADDPFGTGAETPATPAEEGDAAPATDSATPAAEPDPFA